MSYPSWVTKKLLDKFTVEKVFVEGEYRFTRLKSKRVTA